MCVSSMCSISCAKEVKLNPHPLNLQELLKKKAISSRIQTPLFTFLALAFGNVGASKRREYRPQNENHRAGARVHKKNPLNHVIS